MTSSPGQARERLEFARARLAAARESLAAESTGPAAVSLQAAESAADQAEALLNGIEHMEAELTQAASALPTALREIDTDIAEATALPDRTGRWPGRHRGQGAGGGRRRARTSGR